MNLKHALGALSATTLAVGFGTGALSLTAVAGASTPDAATTHTHAVFLETDGTTGNAVLSYARSTDGTISLAGTFATGGLGGVASGATADPLASQGGLALVDGGKSLVSVNAGSDTVSVFAVQGTSLRLTQTIASGGSFPVSVAADGTSVAVLNAGGAGSVALFRLDGHQLKARASQTRSLQLTNTTPPDFLHGAGQIGFTPDGAHLIVTTKASSSSYEVFNVSSSGSLSASPVVTPSATPVPFAFSFDAAGHLVAAEAATSKVSTYTVNADGSLTNLGSVADGATALCWITEARGVFYGSNAGSGTVSSFTVNGSGAPILDAATAATTHPGTTDSAATPNGKFLYVESGGSGAVDGFRVNANGSLTPIETIWNVPVASEGIAVS